MKKGYWVVVYRSASNESAGHKTASMLWRYNIVDARDIKEAGRRTERYLEELNATPKECQPEFKELSQ